MFRPFGVTLANGPGGACAGRGRPAAGDGVPGGDPRDRAALPPPPPDHGRAVLVASIKTRVESACGFSARNYAIINRFQTLLSKSDLRRYTMLFSATLTSGVEELAEVSMKNPARLSADQLGTTPGTLTEEVLKLKPGAAAMKAGADTRPLFRSP